MNGFKLLVDREEDTDFLIAKFPSRFSLYFTAERGGGVSASR